MFKPVSKKIQNPINMLHLASLKWKATKIKLERIKITLYHPVPTTKKLKFQYKAQGV
jgi:hypothetical protein